LSRAKNCDILFYSQQRNQIFLVSKMPRQALEPHILLLNGYRVFSLR